MARPRRVIVGLLAASAVGMILLLAWGCYRWVGRYERDFRGMTEAQVRSILGAPVEDGFRAPPRAGETYSLGWYYLVGSQLVLRFREGKVVDQAYGSK